MTKSYRDYPQYYFDLLEHFERSTEDFPVEGSWGELTALRHNFNRFIKYLMRDAKHDDYALALSRTAEKLRLGLSPGKAPYDTPAIMTAKLDPLYKSMLNLAPTKKMMEGRK